MYCPSCGKVIPDQSAFCLHCGKPTAVSAPAASVAEWEYIYVSWEWKPGKGGHYPLTPGRNEQLIRMNNWGEDQSRFLASLQEYIDNGWQAVSEVGPSGYVFRTNNGNPPWLEVAAFRVKMRRPRSSAIPEHQERLIGKYQVVNIQSKGLYKLALGVIGIAGAKPKEIAFLKNNTFTQLSDKNVLPGIYGFRNPNTLAMTYDPPSTASETFELTWNGSELAMRQLEHMPLTMWLRKIQ